MVDNFTHEFKFQMGDGGIYVEGDCEFDTDGKLSYAVTSISNPIKHDELEDFNNLMETIRTLFAKYGNVKLIRIKQKVV